MKRSNPFRKIYPAFSILCSWFLLWSCSEGPTPGPMSPIKLSEKPSAPAQTPQPSQTGTVRPVPRLAKRESQSLAKAGYNGKKVVRELQDLHDELQAIVTNKPGTYVEYRLNEVLKETNDALIKIQKDVPDDNGTLDEIWKAKFKLQDAMNRGVLSWAQGMQFMAQFNELDEQVRYGVHRNDDYRGQRKDLWIKRTYGGMIKFAGHSIAVPKYATKQDAQFSINVSRNDYITVDFGPDGWFDQQVTVTISYQDADLAGIDPTKLTLAWYDERAGQWVDLGGVVDLVKKTVTAKAWHFTQYTLSTK